MVSGAPFPDQIVLLVLPLGIVLIRLKSSLLRAAYGLHLQSLPSERIHGMSGKCQLALHPFPEPFMKENVQAYYRNQIEK